MSFSLNFGFGKKGDPRAKSQTLLSDAISKKVCVTASYNRGPIHLFQPYAVLQPSDGDDVVLLAVKVDGPVGHSNHDDLETLEVSKLKLLELTTQSFTPDPRFDAKDAKYSDQIIAAV